MTAADVIELLELQPMPVEGGMWAQTWKDEHGTAIYFLLQPDDFSAMHRLRTPELWHHYCGAPVEMLLLAPDGNVDRPVLGDDLRAGHRPFVAVAAGVWMGGATTGDWSLVGTTMAPPFQPSDFEIGVLGPLAEAYPAAADDLPRYVREEHR